MEKSDFFAEFNAIARLAADDVELSTLSSALRGLSEQVVAGEVTDYYQDVDLVSLVLPEVQAPAMFKRGDGRCLLYAGKSHLIAAEPGSGKSWVSVAVTVQAVLDGKHVLYLDFEDNAEAFKQRLIDLGYGSDAVLSEIVYRQVDTRVPFSTYFERVYQDVEDNRYDLVVFDGQAQGLSAAGLDENSNSDFSRWTAQYIRPLLNLGSATLSIDHLSKPAPGADTPRYARGASAKLGDVTGVQYIMTVTESFSRDTAGTSKLVVSKDRGGWVGPAGSTACEITFTPRGKGRLDVDFGSAPSREDAAQAADALLDHDVYFKLLGFGEHGANATHLSSELGIRKQSAIRSLDRLVESGKASVTVGSRGRKDYVAIDLEDQGGGF